MLRALTSYFFGNIQEETPEAPVECETREVNDWLIVNLPDQTKDSINLDDETEADNAVDLDEDDILMSVSVLMQSNGLSNDSMYICDDVCDGVINIPYEPSDEENIMKVSHGNSSTFSDISFEIYRSPDICTECPVSHRALSLAERHPLRCLFFRVQDVLKEKTVTITNTAVTCVCPPKHSKSYVNHRPPIHLQKTDLVQRIKELEPEQKAIRRIAKKNFTKGKLDRQNKNYIYENSSKKNRRSNLQRNHSGVNNNRKC
ncbi:uncharacterized protein NPIL_400961 [Nephila pilipes]|uniref:Uncharacterized protein n=1 Tax=Nephila pilipes TaxID=299642 RepID=A0A8X6Q219_NEPPI|nr:uncharacterized protein NPIL_400961 [Nephila pilipes]